MVLNYSCQPIYGLRTDIPPAVVSGALAGSVCRRPPAESMLPVSRQAGREFSPQGVHPFPLPGNEEAVQCP